MPATQATDAVPHIDPVDSTGSLHRPVMNRENDRIALT